jgi:Leucine-rich repeat (LRR) protein
MEAPPETLFLDGRGLTELPGSLRGSTRLRHLDVRGNRLPALPAWLAELPALESLSIGENPLPGIPPEVIA